MRFASSVSAARDARAAIDELLEPIDARITPGMVDLAFLFSTAHFEDELEDGIETVRKLLPNAMIMGCTADGTIGSDKELERVPSMSMIVGSLPDVAIRPFHIVQSQLEEAVTASAWERLVGVAPESKPIFVAMGDPFRVDLPRFVEQINSTYPGSPLMGGVASAATEPGQNRLIIDGTIHREGIVGLALTGRVAVDTVVSQGCRPIGKPLIITKGERNVIYELGGHSALKQLHNLLVNLSTEDENLAKQALFVGRVINEHEAEFTRGSFLIHNIVGVDRVHGAIGIAGHARAGSTVQFHVRDRISADEDLRALIAPYARTDVRGALLFGCNGRGTQMWDDVGHDVGVLREFIPDVPVAGCFCGGEFGPVGGSNFIHGFTASIGLFRQPAKS